MVTQDSYSWLQIRILWNCNGKTTPTFCPISRYFKRIFFFSLLHTCLTYSCKFWFMLRFFTWTVDVSFVCRYLSWCWNMKWVCSSLWYFQEVIKFGGINAQNIILCGDLVSQNEMDPNRAKWIHRIIELTPIRLELRRSWLVDFFFEKKESSV